MSLVGNRDILNHSIFLDEFKNYVKLSEYEIYVKWLLHHFKNRIIINSNIKYLFPHDIKSRQILKFFTHNKEFLFDPQFYLHSINDFDFEKINLNTKNLLKISNKNTENIFKDVKTNLNWMNNIELQTNSKLF